MQYCMLKLFLVSSTECRDWIFSGLLTEQSLHYPGYSPKKKLKKATPFLSVWYKKSLANANTSTECSTIFMFALLIYKCLHKSMMVAQRHHLLKKLPCRCVCSWSCGVWACIEGQPGGTLPLWSLWNACTSEWGANPQLKSPTVFVHFLCGIGKGAASWYGALCIYADLFFSYFAAEPRQRFFLAKPLFSTLGSQK